MSYIFNDTQKNIRDMVAQFGERDITPLVEELDKEGKFPEDIIKKIAQLQLTGLLLPAEAGGPGLDTLSYCLILEELAKAHASVGLSLEAHNSLALYPISQLGSDEQRSTSLAALASGEIFGTAAVIETDAGYNPEAFETTATPEGDGYVINGQKTLVVNGQIAQKIVVAAKTDSGLGLFLLDREQVTTIEPMYVLGMRSAGITSMRFDNVQVAAEALLGEVGQVDVVWNKAISLHSMGIAAVAVGVGQASLEASVEYANTRIQFKQAIANFPAIQWMIAEMGVDVEASRLLTHKTAALYDDGQSIGHQASLAKYKAAETTMDSAIKCVQIHGGLGFTKESVAERFMRDAKTVQLLGVASEAHKDKVAKKLLGL